MAIHAMIDLETLATDPNATILTIGGVKFNPNSDKDPHSEFYFRLDVDAQEKLGRTQDQGTIDWWGKQDPHIIEEAFGEEDRVGLVHFLDHMTKWMVGVDVLWGHGYGFDVTIVETLYRQMSLPIPWNFWQVKDGRTLIGLLDRDPRKDMQTDLHNALKDAYYQAKAIQVAYSKLYAKINKNTQGLGVNPSNSAASITQEI